ncbi:hypothetical protein ACFVZN_34940, partial [Streptomyces virginiae]
QQHRLGLSSGLSFCCLAFPTLSDSFVSDFLGRFPGFRFRVSLSGGSDSIRGFPPDFSGFEFLK